MLESVFNFRPITLLKIVSKAGTELLIAKLHAYGVGIPSLKLLHSYLTKRKQRVKLNGMYSSWSEILFGVPQGSILGPLLFNIFVQFFPDVDIANYADDNTPHLSNINLNKVLHDLEKNSNTLFKWFTDNLLKANLAKPHLLTNSTQEIQINIGEVAIFLRTKHKKFKLTLVKLPSPVVILKSFWVSILIIN